ncbi:helix-turn-helix domain-containing protein [Azospirillum doebereinerae]|uniref:XRE family transcriptional regulator n=1 Tax=Azospirillum doebereinerae TaxID=92933 RepID=A0A3S0XI39_9PROT|nr:helix-turn-helix transcriptional regulator [Azospirillum doebereinerae]RUQ61250.1 XRE family transcriptional regulator [Azospirillum doebereinerae]
MVELITITGFIEGKIVMAMKKSEEHKKFDDDFIIRLEAIRLHLKLQKQEMADLLGIASNTYSYALRGSATPPPYRLRAIIEKGITSDFMFFGITNGMSETLVKSISSFYNEAEIEINKLRKQ